VNPEETDCHATLNIREIVKSRVRNILSKSAQTTESSRKIDFKARDQPILNSRKSHTVTLENKIERL